MLTANVTGFLGFGLVLALSVDTADYEADLPYELMQGYLVDLGNFCTQGTGPKTGKPAMAKP